MNEIRNLKQFAEHKNVQIAAVDKKGTQNAVIILKKLNIAELPCEKLKKYHREGRIAFILDDCLVHFNKTFADTHLIDLGLCLLKVKQEETVEVLENVSVLHLDQEEYDEIIHVCHEVLDAGAKARLKEERYLQGKLKPLSSQSNSLYLTLKHFLIKNVLNVMSEISRRFIESMQKASEEEGEAKKADAKKHQELKQRLTQERLKTERLNEEIEKRENISDEKRASLEKKTGKFIGEHQA